MREAVYRPCNEAGNALQNRTTVLFYGIERPCFFFKPEPYRFGVFDRLRLCLSSYVLPTCNGHTDSGFPFICAGFKRVRGFLLITRFPYSFPITDTHDALGFLSFLLACRDRFD